jgi:hypothetical protein
MVEVPLVFSAQIMSSSVRAAPEAAKPKRATLAAA